jgi:hypothetical protein
MEERVAEVIFSSIVRGAINAYINQKTSEGEEENPLIKEVISKFEEWENSR